MSNDDPFTLDLFGNTALAFGLGLGVTAFPSSLEIGSDEDERSPTSPAPQRAVAAAGRSPAPLRGENFYLADRRGLAKSWRERARDNLAAICLASEIEQAQRPATTIEQAALIKFIGFGASDLANGVFRRPGEQTFTRAGKRSAPTSRELLRQASMLRSRAVRSTRISRRNSSFA